MVALDLGHGGVGSRSWSGSPEVVVGWIDLMVGPIEVEVGSIEVRGRSDQI